MIALSLMALLYSVMPLVQTRLPNALEMLFALTGLFVLFRYGSGLRWALPVRLMAAAVVIMVISWVFMIMDYPDLARSGPSLEDLLDKFFFLFIALVVAGEEKRARVYLSVCGLFVLVMPWLSGAGTREVMAGIDGLRTGFGINPIRTGLLFGAVLLGLIAFAPRVFLRPRFSVVRLVLWSLVCAFCAVMVVITQSRTAMVALIPGLIVALGVFLFLSSMVTRHKLMVLVAIAAGLMMSIWVAALTGLTDLVETRFGKEAVVIDQVIEGDWEDISNSSWGIRVRLLAEGANGVLERPLTGWGYRAGEIVLDKEGLRRGDGGVFSQVHNTYLEAALRYGIGGAVVLLMLFAWALKGCLKMNRKGRVSLDMTVFLGSALSYLMVASLFDGLLFQTEGVLLFNVLMGVAGSFILFQRRGVHEKREPVHDYAS
ncbi:MAG: O-antigen ligase family protein [Pseudomonadota bacterium]